MGEPHRAPDFLFTLPQHCQFDLNAVSAQRYTGRASLLPGRPQRLWPFTGPLVVELRNKKVTMANASSPAICTLEVHTSLLNRVVHD